MGYRKLLVAIAGLMVASVVAAPAALAAPPEPGFNKGAAIEADFGTTVGNNANAPRSINQGCGSDRNNHAIWFKFTPSTNATITATTNGSAVPDTVLAVYQNGKRLDCDDDDGDGNWSSLTFTAEAGKTYFFTVTSFNGTAGGSITLNLIAS